MPSLTDYKTAHIQRGIGVLNTKVRFYEGDITTEIEWILTSLKDVLGPVTRYRRSRMIREVDYNLGSDWDGNQIDQVLRIELAKDGVRSPIVEQRHA